MAYNYYKILGIDTSAGPGEIKRAYRHLAFKYHPDKNSEAKAKEFFQLLNEAYATLSDIIKKADYDRMLNVNQHIQTAELNERQRRSRRTVQPNMASAYKNREEKDILPPKFARYTLFSTGLIFGLFMLIFPIIQTIEYTFSPTIVFIFFGFILTVDSIAGLTGYKTMLFHEFFKVIKSWLRIDFQNR